MAQPEVGARMKKKAVAKRRAEDLAVISRGASVEELAVIIEVAKKLHLTPAQFIKRNPDFKLIVALVKMAETKWRLSALRAQRDKARSSNSSSQKRDDAGCR
jgi:hypothetical protein